MSLASMDSSTHKASGDFSHNRMPLPTLFLITWLKPKFWFRNCGTLIEDSMFRSRTSYSQLLSRCCFLHYSSKVPPKSNSFGRTRRFRKECISSTMYEMSKVPKKWKGSMMFTVSRSTFRFLVLPVVLAMAQCICLDETEISFNCKMLQHHSWRSILRFDFERCSSVH